MVGRHGGRGCHAERGVQCFVRGMVARLEEAAPLAGETMGFAVGEVLLSVQDEPPGLW